MRFEMDFENWKKKILTVCKRKNEEEEKEFLNLVDQVSGDEGIDVLRVLMKTFFDQDDYGTQERVVSCLQKFKTEIMHQALLEELPRLENEAFEKAEALLETEITFREDSLEKVANTMSLEIKNILKKILNREEFIKYCPEAINFLSKLK